MGRESGVREGLEIGRQEGLEIGRQEGLKLGVCKGCDIGKQDLLKSLIQKKLAKGKSPALIAEELEEDLSVIEDMIQRLNGCSK